MSAGCLYFYVSCSGPSYKRGPPKGYIHAIEQRWHQVESVLGAILASPSPEVKSLIKNLRKDSLANDILTRVDAGPFVRPSLSFRLRINPAAHATRIERSVFRDQVGVRTTQLLSRKKISSLLSSIVHRKQ